MATSVVFQLTGGVGICPFHEVPFLPHASGMVLLGLVHWEDHRARLILSDRIYVCAPLRAGRRQSAEEFIKV